MADEPQAESSPAEEDVPEFEKLTTEQRDKFLETGKVEAPKPKRQESAPASSEAEEPEGVPAPAPGKKETRESQREGKPAQNAETRKQQLAAEVQELLTQRRQLRDEVNRLKTGEKPAESPTARPVTQGDDAEPNPENEEKYPMGAYDPKFVKDLSAWQFRQLRAEEQRAEQQKEARKQAEVVETTWKQRTQAAAERYPDFAEKAYRPELDRLIPEGSVMDGYILTNEAGADLLYYLGGNLAEAERIGNLDPYSAMEALVAIKQSLSSKATPQRKLTAAKPPGSVLGGTNKAPEDEAEAALATGDTARYIEVMNKRDAARFLRK